MRVYGLLLRWQLWISTYYVSFFFFFFFLSWLCCPLRLQNSSQICLWEGFLLCGNFSSFMTPSPGWISVPILLSLFLSFIFCSTSFWREWPVFLSAWCPPTALRICFVEVAQHSNDLVMNLWGRKWSHLPIHLRSWDCLQSWLIMSL